MRGGLGERSLQVLPSVRDFLEQPGGCRGNWLRSEQNRKSDASQPSATQNKHLRCSLQWKLKALMPPGAA